MDTTISTIEAEVAMLLRLAGRPVRPSSALHGTLERSAYLVLGLLHDQPHAQVNAIAARLRLDASTVTRQVIAMETAGLVTRGHGAADGRATVVRATAAGRAALAETRAARSGLYADVLADWDEADRHALATLLTRLNASLDERARRVSAPAPVTAPAPVSAPAPVTA